jgi:hypothetical protein
MKPSTALAWTKKQRALLSGRRGAHRNDPPARDEPAEAWARLRAWMTNASAMPDRTRDRALRDAIEAVRTEVAPPVSLDPSREALRRLVAEASIGHLGTHAWNEPLAASLARLWASIEPLSALSLPGAVPRPESVAPGLEVLALHPPSTTEWLAYPFGLGRYDMGMGFEYWGALRGRAFSLDEATFGRELEAAAALRRQVIESDRADRMTMLFALAFVFARDGTWAAEHAADVVETPKLGQFPGASLLAPSLTDQPLALALMRAHSNWIDRYTGNLSHLFDIVEGLGSAASPVLRGISTYALKPSVRKRIAEAIALAES